MKLIILPLLLLLGGCSYINALRSIIAVRGAEIDATALNDAEWFVCKRASAESIRKRYGKSTERASAWREFCKSDTKSTVVAPD